MVVRASENCRCAPDRMICTTLVAVGSFTDRAPVSVAYGITGLTPEQSWQPAHAPAYTALPIGSTLAATPCAYEEEAGFAFGSGGSDVAAADMERTDVTMAAISLCVRYCRLLSTASPMGPVAVPRPSACPIER